MSKICYALLQGSMDCKRNILSEIKRIADRYGFGYYILKTIDEPFFDCNRSDFIISFSDNYIYDNCEMLLLPDGCTYNGKTSKTSFFERMTMIRNVTDLLKENHFRVELYVGESGTESEDYLDFSCESSDIPNVICKHLNDFYDCNLHIIVE